WWLMEIGLKLDQLEPGEFDSVLGNGTGAGVIFGNTGGVTESVLRQLHFTWTGKEPPKDWLLFTPVRGLDAIRRAEVKIGGKTLRVGIVHGAGNIRRLLETKEHLKFDFVEVMACPGGCIGGGGQPKTELPVTDALRTKRMSGLFSADKTREKRRCGENPDLVALYENFLKEPGNKLLHTR
ncbi:MAG: iron hydrogenase small subunit, partial [Thermoguttaceae bacterium]|nr:iron hydrogenase small subunit [Thermoguttaceae bacterium]